MDDSRYQQDRLKPYRAASAAGSTTAPARLSEIVNQKIIQRITFTSNALENGLFRIRIAIIFAGPVL